MSFTKYPSSGRKAIWDGIYIVERHKFAIRTHLPRLPNRTEMVLLPNAETLLNPDYHIVQTAQIAENRATPGLTNSRERQRPKIPSHKLLPRLQGRK